MIKKMLALVCVIALAAVSVVGASAATIISQYQDGYSEIAYDNPANFEVVIPETIDAAEGTLTFNANSMHLHANEVVEVISKIGNSVDLISETTQDVAKYNFGADSDGALARFADGELTSQITLYPYVENAREIAAAHYSSSITFNVRIVEQP